MSDVLVRIKRAVLAEQIREQLERPTGVVEL